MVRAHLHLLIIIIVVCWGAAAGCHSRPQRSALIHYPITSGMHRQIPVDGMSFCVAVNQSIAQESAIRWLEQHGYAVRTAPCRLSLTVEVGQEAAIRGGTTPTVDIRVVESDTGAMLLWGTAAMPISSRPDDVVAGLTCQALATAWGFRPSGQLNIPSALMCTVGTAASAVRRG